MKKIKLAAILPLATLIASCASTPNSDPLEGLNRKTYAFNTVVDKAVLRPVAKGYNTITPQPVQARVTHFFANFDEFPTIANDILQGQVYYTCNDSSRLLVNSTIGLLGLFDVASHLNLPPHDNDFGLTLARYGVKNSPYFVIPIFGPSTIRDGIGSAADIFVSPYYWINDQTTAWSLYAVNKINQRAALLPTDKLVDQAFDPYVFVRDAYLQHRQAQVAQALSNQPASSDTYVESTTTQAKGPTSTSGVDTYVPPDNTPTTQSDSTKSPTSSNDNKKTSAQISAINNANGSELAVNLPVPNHTQLG